MEKYPKAILGEQRWVDYDEETALWGIFGLLSGHCYSTYASEEEAQQHLTE
jgi:hypothetical protein